MGLTHQKMSSAPGCRGVPGELNESCFGGVLKVKSERGGFKGKWDMRN